MKFNCGLTAAELAEQKRRKAKQELEYLENWHPFYPIWPRQVASGDCRAFEWIERKGTLYRGHGEYGTGYYWWMWEYRARG